MTDATSVVCLDWAGRFSDRDRQRDHPFSFEVPIDAGRLLLRFAYRPGTVGDFRNLLTLSLFDPRGFRGAGHRGESNQQINISSDVATPGFLPGPIDPGRWTVELHAHEILNDGGRSGWCEATLTVVAELDGGATRASARPGTRDPRDNPLVPRRVNRRTDWYRGDLHSHSVHCDGSSTIAEMGQAAVQIGLDFLATTCHNTTSGWMVEVPWPERLLWIRGIECTTYWGHANILGTSAWVDWRMPRATVTQAITAQAARQNAVVVINHPAAIGNPLCTGCTWEGSLEDIQGIDAIEVWNSRWRTQDARNPAALALWTDLLNLGHRVAAVAGTDSHAVEDYADRALPYTSVYSAGLGEADILDALRRGRANLSSGAGLAFRARGADGEEATLPGDCLTLDGPMHLDVSVRSLASDATLWCVADGVPQRLGHLGAGDAVVTADATADRWWRLELRAGNDVEDDLLFLTNPVYIVGG